MTLKASPLQPQTIDLSQDSFPAILRTWQGNSLELPANGTHFGYIYQGQSLLSRQSEPEGYRVRSGMYFCLPGAGRIEGETSSGMVVTRLNYSGMFSLGGPIEPTGRFAYIDGGTSSLLIPPMMCGDPCLNAMYFPPYVDQTLHTHPSYRIGLVVAGQGTLEDWQTVTHLEPGMMFLILANSLHKFRTAERNLTVVVFHPDSDTGFTHRDNPILKRTMVDGVSATELPQIQTQLVGESHNQTIRQR